MKEKRKKLFPGLRYEMLKNGDIQETLCKELNITKATFNHRINGKSEWTMSDIEYLCKKYNKDYYELFK